ncbi:natural product biosynthesis luciferase-like monooxygenase domain-containing protein [Rhizobium mongolense subsp. loessense]|uniref:Natural product biosynthesis luciferase-like monooxygenase domain-containing protein n=1 Tax=Rhizobium mongolense subsp. loessense TaxID=158890 RepID=A0A1G4UAP0_9HYPH|nr:MupA/Atu3671 family FMN-dependent luciferase-like monooxygenase [Rhizobium mongolense]SCW90728.1 natural product biosynthesis luciferase-like monooxygenase domain-containing protein [Rhizobium mongolense subsp. loessense]
MPSDQFGLAEVALPLPPVNHLSAGMHHAAHETTSKVKLSLSFFSNDDRGKPGADNYRLLLDATKFADRNGFEAVWLPERHFHAFGGLFPNPSVLAAALSTVTTKIGLRAGSVVSPLHNPIRIAEEWAVIDNLSNGRVGISFAAGWNANDFILSTTEFEARRERVSSDVDVVRKLWQGDDVIISDRPVKTFPRPMQHSLPIWLTTTGRPESFIAAGRIGANVLTHLRGQELNELPAKIELYRRSRKESGYDGEGQVTLMMHTYVHEDRVRAIKDIQQPLMAYLGSSLDLTHASTKRVKHERRNSATAAALRDAMLLEACERYMNESGLFGTPQDVIATVEQLDRAGVDEIACLVDFGVDYTNAMASLSLLADIKNSLAVRHRSDHVRQSD